MTKTRNLADLGGGFIQAGTGAVQRTVVSKLQDVVSVKDFGATGNGVTDDNVAIQAAVAASANKLLYFPPGVYVTSGFDVQTGTTLLGYGATLNFSSKTRASRIRVNGAIGSNINLSANGSVGATTISVTSAAGIVPGDMLLISSNKLVLSGSFSGGSTETIGEFQFVESVAGNVITLKSQLRDSYLTADTAKIAKVTPNSNVAILGLKLIGAGTLNTGSDSSEIGITALYTKNLRIQDVEIINCDYQAISIDQSYHAVVENCSIEFQDSGNENVIQYGCALKGASEANVVTKCSFLRGRHGIAWTENANPGVGRNDIISDNVIINTKQAAITTHESNQDFTITGNIIDRCVRGIDVRTYYATITDNRITLKDSTDSQADGIYLSRTPHNILISGNTISNSRHGVRMYNLGLDNGFNPYNITITDNVITNTSLRAIYLQQTEGPGPMTGFAITNNVITECGNDYINLDGEFSQAVISFNQCRALTDGSTAGRAVKLQGTTGTIISGNHLLLHENDVNAIRLEADTQSTPENCDYASVFNNIWESSAGLFSQTGATNFTFYNNSRLNESTNRVISAGVVEAPYGRPFMRVGGEGGTADELVTINGGTPGDLLACYALSDNQDITFKDGTGNLRLSGGDFTTATTDDVLLLFNAGGTWLEVSRSTN